MQKGGTEQIKSAGFTIVETLIVLAVTGMMFLAAIIYINGRQAKTEFQVGSQQLQQMFQQVINETENGYYPNDETLTCTSSSGKPKLSTSGSSTGTGTNSDCVFAGKVIVIGGTQGKETYKVFSLVGLRQSGGSDVTSVAQAQPVAIAKISGSDPDATEIVKLPIGFTYAGGFTDAASPVSAGTYFNTAIISNFAPSSLDVSDTGAGAQTFSLRGFANNWASTANTTTAQATQINAETTYPPITGSVNYCFASGGTDQSVLVTIDKGLRVSSAIKTGTKCGVALP